MNTMIKVGIASALAMGYATAHATITIPGSTGSQSDVMLFAEVVSGSTVLGSYAGDTGIATGTTLTSSNLKVSNTSDSNLQSLLTLGASTGNTVEWAVLGGKFGIEGTNSSGDYYLSTLTGGASVTNTLTDVNYSEWSTILTNTLNTVQTNAGTANSVFASTVAKGGVWDSTDGPTATANLANWNLNGSNNVITGLTTGTGATLYGVTTGNSATDPAQSVTALGTLSLTASGLSFSTGGGTSPIPLPAAIWLLGSGLLGLAGVGRRKATTAV